MNRTSHIRVIAASLLLPLGISTATAPAIARIEPVRTVATVEWDHRPRSRVVSDGIVWRCERTTCVALVHNDPATFLRACYRLARKIGAVASFQTPAGAMSEEDLDRCNRRGRDGGK